MTDLVERSSCINFMLRAEMLARTRLRLPQTAITLAQTVSFKQCLHFWIHAVRDILFSREGKPHLAPCVYAIGKLVVLVTIYNPQ